MNIKAASTNKEVKIEATRFSFSPIVLMNIFKDIPLMQASADKLL